MSITHLSAQHAAALDSLSSAIVEKDGLNDKLKDLFASQQIDQVPAKTNEKGEILNEEGLPITEINEKEDASDTVSIQASPFGASSSPSLSPSSRTQQQLREERDRILDALEQEEEDESQLEIVRNENARKEEVLRRQKDAAADIERRRVARELQKKMGRALIRKVVEDKAKAGQQGLASLEHPASQSLISQGKTTTKLRKTVSFVEPVKTDGDGATKQSRPLQSPRYPVKRDVFERLLGKKPTASAPDSDDELEEHEDSGENLEFSYGDLEVAEEEIDVETARMGREVALSYHTKRDDIATQYKNISQGAPGPWDAPEVPVEATFAHFPPKSKTSLFKQAHFSGNRPSETQRSIIRSTVKLGRVVCDELVGSGDSDDNAQSEMAKSTLDDLRKGTVTDPSPSNSVMVSQRGSSDESNMLDPAVVSSEFCCKPNLIPYQLLSSSNNHTQQFPSVIVESPDFPRPSQPKRLEQPPTVMSSTVKEHATIRDTPMSSSAKDSQEPSRISRFKAQRQNLS